MTVPILSAAIGAPSLSLNFVDLNTLDPRITFTRASVASYFDVAGTLQSAASGAPRFDYDPVTHAPLGLLIEEARTNSIRNSTMVGALPGTPGTLPTNWTSGQNTTLNPNVIGTGTENGIPYIDLQITGTAGAGVNDIKFDTPTGIAGLTGQTWTFSSYLRLVAGTLANVSAIRHVIYENTSGGVFVTQGVGVLATPTAAALNTQRNVTSYTTAGGGTVAALQPMLELALTAGAVNFTLRLGAPQLELGAFSTSPIVTAGAAVTRAADVASIAAGAWYKPAGYSITAQCDAIAAGGIVYSLTDASGSTNRLQIQLGAFKPTTTLSSGGVNSLANPETATVTANTVFATGSSLIAGTYMSSLNGAAPFVSTTGIVMPAGITQLALGQYVGGNILQLNGHLRRVRYWPRALGAAELQSVTM